jgi:hypothetical protein
MPGPDKQLVPIVDDPCRAESILDRTRPQRPKGGVERAGTHLGHGGRGIGTGQSDNVEFDAGALLVEGVQNPGGRDPTADHVDPQRPTPRRHGGGHPFRRVEEVTRVRQQRLPVHGEPRTPGRPREEPHAQLPLQVGHPLRSRLLGNPKIIGGGLELPSLRDSDKGTHSIEIHSANLRPQQTVVARHAPGCHNGSRRGCPPFRSRLHEEGVLHCLGSHPSRSPQDSYT